MKATTYTNATERSSAPVQSRFSMALRQRASAKSMLSALRQCKNNHRLYLLAAHNLYMHLIEQIGSA
jgi:hypothetical protein